MKFDPARRKAMGVMAAAPVAVATMGQHPMGHPTPPVVPGRYVGGAAECATDAATEYTLQMRLRDLRNKLAQGYGENDPYSLSCSLQDIKHQYMQKNVEALRSVSGTSKYRIALERGVLINRQGWEERVQIEIDTLFSRHPYLRTLQNLL